MTWVQFEVTGATGRPATLGVKVKLEVVECWVGGLVVVLDRDAFVGWLAAPRGSFARDEVTFEPDPNGLAVEFAGRVQRSVLTPDAVARLTAAVSKQLPPVDVAAAFRTVRASTSNAAAGDPS